MSNKANFSGERGFTLIELLIVIAIIAILAAVVFVALDPLTRFRDARDSARFTDVSAVLSAIRVYQVDNGGFYDYAISHIASQATGTPYMISSGTSTTACNDVCDVGIAANACVPLTGLVNRGYLGKLPTSTDGIHAWSAESINTGYYLTLNDNGSITVGACESENTAEIRVTR